MAEGSSSAADRLTVTRQGALALVAFGKVADDVMEKESQQLDDFVLYGLRQFQSPQLDAVARIISALGSEIVALALVVFLVFFLIRHRYGAAVTSAAKEKSKQKYYYTDNAATCDKPAAGDTATIINI